MKSCFITYSLHHVHDYDHYYSVLSLEKGSIGEHYWHHSMGRVSQSPKSHLMNAMIAIVID